ncbi:MAG: rhodanese-like domain-containing protein [Candidatus Zixiibacteriota bacterium]|nr:MAG: rhodanese-like domain-containing protein [candidate division Zixibacteria bacterium]
MLKQAIILLILALILSVLANIVSPNKIAFVGQYRDLSSGDGPIIPPAAEPGDPPFIDINVAQFEFTAGTSIFVDAREPEEYECGTIPGSINIPFEHLPDDLEVYFDSALQGCSKEAPIIVFCSGEECDSSLHLARNLQDHGYVSVSIFFGGSREWDKHGFEMEKIAECGQ